MATLWAIVTGNSTLPVQAGNNFWDHLNNQAGGGGGAPQLIPVLDSIAVVVEQPTILAVVVDPTIETDNRQSSISVTSGNTNVKVVVEDNKINIE